MTGCATNKQCKASKLDAASTQPAFRPPAAKKCRGHENKTAHRKCCCYEKPINNTLTHQPLRPVADARNCTNHHQHRKQHEVENRKTFHHTTQRPRKRSEHEIHSSILSKQNHHDDDFMPTHQRGALSHARQCSRRSQTRSDRHDAKGQSTPRAPSVPDATA